MVDCGVSYFEQIMAARVAASHLHGSRIETALKAAGAPDSAAHEAVLEDAHALWRKQAREMGCQGGVQLVNAVRNSLHLQARSVQKVANWADSLSFIDQNHLPMGADERLLGEAYTNTFRQITAGQFDQFDGKAQSLADQFIAGSKTTNHYTVRNLVDQLWNALSMQYHAKRAGFEPRLERVDDSHVMPVLRALDGTGSPLILVGMPSISPSTGST